ncbi:MAG: tetratricopeptide repeat protein [Deltaproteobacteria bacterium]|nr:tetratricopeptide repeat protein [Deltaproteobacteria bacterium]
MDGLQAFRDALRDQADEDALDRLAADLRKDEGMPAFVAALRLRIEHELRQGKTDLEVTGLRFRLAGALDEIARGTPSRDGVEAAVEAAALYRDVLGDIESASKSLVLALRAGVHDDLLAKRALEAAGGGEQARGLVERALKRPEVKENLVETALLRRSLSRIAEVGGDKERAFFEALKAARKQPAEPLYVDDVYRLSLDTKRFTEAAAFFQDLAADQAIPPRQRAGLLHKLGQTREQLGEKAAAVEAFRGSLALHDAKGPRRALERLAAELGIEVVPPGAATLELQAIAAEEPIDVTPSYPPNRIFTITKSALEQAPVTDDAPRPEHEVTDDHLVDVTDKPRRGHGTPPDEVTLPRMDTSLRTGSLDAPLLPPPIPLDDAPAPSAVPPPVPLDDARAPDVAPALEDQPSIAAVPLPSLASFGDEPPLSSSPTAPVPMRLEDLLPQRPPAVPEAEPTRRAPHAGAFATREDQSLDSNSGPTVEGAPTGKRKRKDKKKKRGAAPQPALAAAPPPPPPPTPPPPPPPPPPPLAELTTRAPSSPAPATEEALPPLVVPPMTMPSMEASDALAVALAALESSDVEQCVAAARALAHEAPHDARVLRLAARALTLAAPSGALPEPAVELFRKEAPRHGDRAAGLALEVQHLLPPTAVASYTPLWIAGAAAAGHDGPRVLDLLRAVAVLDAPDGPAFALAERVLEETRDAAGMDTLLVASCNHATTDGAKAALVARRLKLLEGQSRYTEALPLHGQLAIELRPNDVPTRAAARRAHAERGTPDERARFLAKLARRLPGEDGADVLHELLDVRLSVDDKIGAEAAARDVLERRPGDARALRVLAEVMAADPRREAELVEVLRIAAHDAVGGLGRAAEARTLLEQLAHLHTKAGRADEAADALVQVARLVPDEATLEQALVALDEGKRHKEAIALLEEVAAAVADSAWRALALVRAADIARARLAKRGKARELLERALDLVPKDRGALAAYADLLIEIGDGDAALTALERLVAAEPDAKARAALQLRVGRLLEEHLLRPDDALKRYRACVEADAGQVEAWEAIRSLARTRGDRALLIEALGGLAATKAEPAERAALWRQVAKVERDERADAAAAERAFVEALRHDPADLEALNGLVTLVIGRLQPELDVDAALAAPSEAVVEAVRAYVTQAGASTTLPLPLARLDALCRSRSGDRAGARDVFERLLSEHPEDLPTLLAYARHLAAAPRLEVATAEPRRLRVLESILVHHAFALKPAVHVDVWGEVTALRAAGNDHAGALKAAKKVVALAVTSELQGVLSDRAVRAIATALETAKEPERDAKAAVLALRLDAERSLVEGEQARLLERAARIAQLELSDRPLARSLLERALAKCPESSSVRDALLELDLSAGDVAGVLKQVRELLARESDVKQKALLHLRLFRLAKKLGLDDHGAAAELKAALDLDPTSSDVLDAAERFFTEKHDADGLDKLWSAQLRTLDRVDVRARIKLLERLAQLRRWERRDLVGAVEALEAMSALEPDALKPREDAARLYTELHMPREAIGAWRGVLERDPLVAEAWRGLLARYVALEHGDEAFAVASTMLALDLVDDEVARVVRTIRPPFPRWPIPPKDAQVFRRKVAHPLEKAPARAILDLCGPRLLPLYARPLRDFGIRKKDALPDKQVPTSVLLAVRTLAQLLGLREPPMLFSAELGSTQGVSPAFAVLPATEPGIIVAPDVVKGGMTPERAFALGRAATWLQPHAVLAAAVESPNLRMLLEALVAQFLGAKNLERPDTDAEQLGRELSRALLAGVTKDDEAALKGELVPALRDYVHARSQVQVADWKAGVGYTGDRVGFLLSTDLSAAFKVIKSTAGTAQSVGARLATKELVLFSVSPAYLGLRKDLGIALPEQAAMPLLDVA